MIAINGSKYKICSRGFVWYFHGGDWQRSTKSADDLLNDQAMENRVIETRRKHAEGQQRRGRNHTRQTASRERRLARPVPGV
jgi:hypothetical protein